MREAIDRGALVVLFPEGTSSDGSTVLPFKSALLQPASELGGNIHVAAIDYTLPGGSVADEICYWRDMTLVPHLLKLFAKPTIQAKVTFAAAKPGADRKEFACDLRQQIIGLRS